MVPAVSQYKISKSPNGCKDFESQADTKCGNFRNSLYFFQKYSYSINVHN